MFWAIGPIRAKQPIFRPTMKRHTILYSNCLRAALGASAVLFAACEKAEPVTYTIPKEEQVTKATQMPADHPPIAGSGAAAGNMQMLPGMAEAAAAAPGLTYSIPEGWTDAGATGMRKANLRVEDEHGTTEITALTFPGDVGGLLANINRWAGQIGMDAITEAQLPEVTAPANISGHGGLYVSLPGPERSILGGILPFHGDTWFFKMTGPAATITEQEAAFKVFLDSVAIEDSHH